MKGTVVPAAVMTWAVGAALMLFLGWRGDPASWRITVGSLSGVAVVVLVILAAWKERTPLLVGALAATLVTLVAVPPPVGGVAGMVGVIVAGAMVLAAYYTLQLSLRMHAQTGAVLIHGASRIAGTILAAAVLVVLVVVGLRVASDGVSMRWEVSLDAASGHLLVVVAALLMSVMTAVSLGMLAKGRHGFDHEAEGRGEESDG